MLYKLPRHTPPLGVMLADLGNPHPREIAKALGVGQSTVRRWITHDDAPKPVLLSLFWLTHWGMQWLDVDLFNRCQAYAGLANALQKELAIVTRADHEKTAPELPQAPPLLYVVR